MVRREDDAPAEVADDAPADDVAAADTNEDDDYEDEYDITDYDEDAMYEDYESRYKAEIISNQLIFLIIVPMDGVFMMRGNQLKTFSHMVAMKIRIITRDRLK